MKRAIQIIIGLVVVAVIAGVGMIVYLQTGAEPSADVNEGVERLEAESAEATVFSIVSAESTAEYNIEEVLNGNDFTVVGTTSDVAGDIVVDAANPAASEIGEIRINARTFETESSNRDGAVRRFILRSAEDEFEFITFQPTSLVGMPVSVAVGDTFEFQIVGDLTVKGETHEVTFDASVTAESEARITGTAETTLVYEDVGVTIPRLPPQVASVEDDVRLAITFVAVAGSPEAAA